jgi:hypothetical protein
MPTVTFLKEKLQDRIAPGDDVAFLRLLTEADMRLLEYGRWRWTRKSTTLSHEDGIITLPVAYSSILGARVGKEPVDIRAEEFEYVPGGVGEVDLGVGSSRLIDQGVNDEGFRQYKVTGHLDDTDIISAMVMFAPVTLYDPDIPDSSLPEDATTNTLCPDVTALKLMMLGIIFEEASDLGNARSFISDAIKGLDNKEQNQRGNARQSVNVRSRGVGVSRIRSWR